MISKEELKELLSYDPLSGDFNWRNSGRGRPLSKKAGAILTSSNKKYIQIMINKKNYLAHRLAFVYMTGNEPNGTVDHINGDGCDNRWENLRDVEFAENMRNVRRNSCNSSGVTGVYFRNDTKKWCVQIGVKGKTVTVGSFSSFEDAVRERKSAEFKYGYHENHGSERPL